MMTSKNKGMIVKKIVSSVLLGVVCALLSVLLKYLTEFIEVSVLGFLAESRLAILLIIMPMLGLLSIWLSNRFIFKGSASKGITEVLDVVGKRSKSLNPMKIVSHFFSGLFTVSTGGSTGIEVSSVISSGAIGSVFSDVVRDAKFKRYMVMAGAAAGIATLFNSPLGGLFFVIEILLTGAISLELLSVIGLALAGAYFVTWNLDSTSLFKVTIREWHWHAIPYFIGFSIITALVSVYLTKLVVVTKSIFVRNFMGVNRVLYGGLLTGMCLFLFLPLYGEGYKTIQELLTGDSTHFISGIFGNKFSGSFLLLCLILVLLVKPIATSLTLASGGDGGVFAPSLFLGAIAGLFFSHGLNIVASANLIEVNFMIVGMAAILGASIHAPLTAVFLIASITGSYVLFLPLLMTSILSKVISKMILPYTVYSYARAK